MNPKVSVIIPTKNEEKTIGRCLTSLKAQIYKNLEIIVVDNASEDKTVKIAKKYTQKVFQKGLERSTQRNFGAKKATGDILFFVDADMEVTRNVLAQAVKLFKKDKKLKATIIPEASCGENYWAHVRALERDCYLGEPTIEAARIFEKKAFLKAGGFDKNLIAAEDWDLNERVKKLGKIGRTDAKIIHHEGKLSLLAHLRKKYYYGQNVHLFAQKHPERFKEKKGIRRAKIFAKNWKRLIADPIHGLGVFILKSLEYFAFVLASQK